MRDQGERGRGQEGEKRMGKGGRVGRGEKRRGRGRVREREDVQVWD